MRHSKAFLVAFALFGITTARAEVVIPEQQPFAIPDEVRQSLDTLAGESDVFVFGETHGTKEVPAVLEELLPALSKRGYGALALEVPHDQQAALALWAKEDSAELPRFFAKPSPDGRGNQQVLALVRRAVRPPYGWKLICFDATDEEFSQQMMRSFAKNANGTIAERAAKLSSDEIVAISLERDAMMAKNFAAERDKLPSKSKIAVVCGNVHARTANHAMAESPLKKLWPSFVAVLKQGHPQWQIRSLNVQAFGGEYFNAGKVRKFGERKLAKTEARPTPGADWDWELNLPVASAATFISPPK